MTQAQASTFAATASDIAAQAQQDGFMNGEGFFAQSDWEFELDTMQAKSREALEAHLAKSPDHETAMFLKGYLMDSGSHFTRFED